MQNASLSQAPLPENVIVIPYILPIPVQPAPMEAMNENDRRPFSTQEKRLIDTACTVGGATIGTGAGLAGAGICALPLWSSIIGTGAGVLIGMYSTTTQKFSQFINCIAPKRSYNSPG